MAYTTIDDASLYFRVKTYSGSSSDGNAVTWDETHANMQPDWLWLKNRTDAQEHWLADVVRGTGKFLESNSTNAESSDGASGLASFDTNGFTLNNSARTNRNTMVGWGWKAGTSFTNDASSTGIGTIDSTGSANDTAGFSIVTYTGNGTSGATVKHGLSSALGVLIVKSRSEARNWGVFHQSNGGTKNLSLDTTDAVEVNAGRWNNTAPTSSVFTLGNSTPVNNNGITYVAYCFAEKKGYSKFGSYTGNGNADGAFVYTGFKPAWVLLKQTDSAGSWNLYDNKRNGFNVDNDLILTDASNAEANATFIDFLSNGFKIRDTDDDRNASNGTYVFMAFAESPFVNSNGVPNNAR
jgi:hypothetical protein